ncbi:kinesin-like protein costa isoform X2 [Nomia melanderi]|nr:kinesin-like protein costa isoform X2 [Nomia melanderi]
MLLTTEEKAANEEEIGSVDISGRLEEPIYSMQIWNFKMLLEHFPKLVQEAEDIFTRLNRNMLPLHLQEDIADWFSLKEEYEYYIFSNNNQWYEETTRQTMQTVQRTGERNRETLRQSSPDKEQKTAVKHFEQEGCNNYNSQNVEKSSKVEKAIGLGKYVNVEEDETDGDEEEGDEKNDEEEDDNDEEKIDPDYYDTGSESPNQKSLRRIKIEKNSGLKLVKVEEHSSASNCLTCSACLESKVSDDKGEGVEVEEEDTDEDELREDEEEQEENDDIDDEEEDEDDYVTRLDNSVFQEKLNEYMKQFKIQTDDIIKIETYDIIKAGSHDDTSESIVKPVAVRRRNSRRNSILPGSEMCNEILAFNNNLKSNQNQMMNNKILEFPGSEIVHDCTPEPIMEQNPSKSKNNSTDLLIDVLETKKLPEPIKELKILMSNNDAKQTQMKKIQLSLDEAQKHMKELKSTAKIRLFMMEDLAKNENTLAKATAKFQHKRTELEKRCSQTESKISEVKSRPDYDFFFKKPLLKKKIELYRNRTVYYKNRLRDIAMIHQTALESFKNSTKIWQSLNASTEEMINLKRQLITEVERKQQLEEELAEDQKKIHELEEKYNLTASKLKEIQSDSEDAKINDKLKSNYPDKKKNLLDVSARITHLDTVLKEKSIDLERTADIDEKEALRNEIQNLRRTRDCLVDEKCDLDEKFQKEKALSTVEERKLLECGETIEAIDAMIEHKNEMICGRKGFDENQAQREKGERMLMERLAKLSEGEMKTLFYKYFLKVIDLKESSKNLEVQVAELESHIETQKWEIQTLTNALKQTKLEAERRIVLMQRKYEQKLLAMYRHIGEETSSSGPETLDTDTELARHIEENENYPYPVRIPPPANAVQRPTTKVTKERNKLIIQKTTGRDKRRK